MDANGKPFNKEKHKADVRKSRQLKKNRTMKRSDRAGDIEESVSVESFVVSDLSSTEKKKDNDYFDELFANVNVANTPKQYEMDKSSTAEDKSDKSNSNKSSNGVQKTQVTQASPVKSCQTQEDNPKSDISVEISERFRGSPSMQPTQRADTKDSECSVGQALEDSPLLRYSLMAAGILGILAFKYRRT